MYQRILVPTDGSELSTRAADAAIALARSLGARLLAWSSAEVYSLPFAVQPFAGDRGGLEGIEPADERLGRVAEEALDPAPIVVLEEGAGRVL
ncbi:MAG TPA: universal stress protein, partial [Chiayiivirga sp.]|nr:universal stress protein [Chiayiivirga sp.]